MPRSKREGITDIAGVDGMGWVGGRDGEVVGRQRTFSVSQGRGEEFEKKQRKEKKEQAEKQEGGGMVEKLYEVRREFGQDSKRQTVKRNETWLRDIKQEDRE